MFKRGNSLIADLVFLLSRFISLFARRGNLLPAVMKYQSLRGRSCAAGVESAFSQYFPVDQGSFGAGPVAWPFPLRRFSRRAGIPNPSRKRTWTREAGGGCSSGSNTLG